MAPVSITQRREDIDYHPTAHGSLNKKAKVTSHLSYLLACLKRPTMAYGLLFLLKYFLKGTEKKA